MRFLSRKSHPPLTSHWSDLQSHAMRWSHELLDPGEISLWLGHFPSPSSGFLGKVPFLWDHCYSHLTQIEGHGNLFKIASFLPSQ